MSTQSSNPPDVVVYMSLAQHGELNKTLYGPKHSFGERSLYFEMTSVHKYLTLNVPVICRYKDNKPTLRCNRVTKDDWRDFCYLLEEKRSSRLSSATGRVTFAVKHYELVRSHREMVVWKFLLDGKSMMKLYLFF
ncbi:hypothetical protein T440DRAFT_538424, partial [Plenodomus tracheiphilus IPT5]